MLPRNKPLGKAKKVIMLRDSLPGGWKIVDDDEAQDAVAGRKKGAGRKWRMSEVEILDLSQE